MANRLYLPTSDKRSPAEIHWNNTKQNHLEEVESLRDIIDEKNSGI